MLAVFFNVNADPTRPACVSADIAYLFEYVITLLFHVMKYMGTVQTWMCVGDATVCRVTLDTCWHARVVCAAGSVLLSGVRSSVRLSVCLSHPAATRRSPISLGVIQHHNTVNTNRVMFPPLGRALRRVCCCEPGEPERDNDRLLHGRRAGGQQQPRRSSGTRMRAVPRCRRT